MALLRGFAIVAYIAVACILLQVGADEEPRTSETPEEIHQECLQRVGLSKEEYEQLQDEQRNTKKLFCLGICENIRIQTKIRPEIGEKFVQLWKVNNCNP